MVALLDSGGKASEKDPLKVEYSVIDPKVQVVRKANTSESQSKQDNSNISQN